MRVIAIAAGALLIPATAAQGATKDMFAGTPPKGVPDFVSDNAFYAKKVTIHQGDRVRFKTLGFHNILLASARTGSTRARSTRASRSGPRS